MWKFVKWDLKSIKKEQLKYVEECKIYDMYKKYQKNVLLEHVIKFRLHIICGFWNNTCTFIYKWYSNLRQTF